MFCGPRPKIQASVFLNVQPDTKRAPQMWMPHIHSFYKYWVPTTFQILFGVLGMYQSTKQRFLPLGGFNIYVLLSVGKHSKFGSQRQHTNSGQLYITVSHLCYERAGSGGKNPISKNCGSHWCRTLGYSAWFNWSTYGVLSLLSEYSSNWWTWSQSMAESGWW